MKKTLKLVAILISVLVVVIVGGLSIYFLVQNNQTYYIYDLRLVEPVADEYGYVYIDGDKTYNSIKNKSVYLTSSKQNRFQISVYARTSNGTTNVLPVSSNTDVAKIVYENGSCYVNYLKAGQTTISVSIGTVVDSFVLTVYDQIAEDFVVVDDKYYGDYAERFPNSIVLYSDGTEYEYTYRVSTAMSENSEYKINNDMLRVMNIDNDIIESVKLDAQKQSILIKAKSGLEANVDTSITIQSYTISEDGKVKVLENQDISLHIVARTPEFLQMEISSTPDFDENCVFVNTIYPESKPDFDDPQIKDKLEEYLDYKKAEQTLSERAEKAIYHTYFTEKVNSIFIRFRTVYTNGDVVYLSPNDASLPYQNISEENPFHITSNDNSKLTLSANKKYYILNLSKSDISGTFDITLSLDDKNFLSHTFKIEYADFNKDTIEFFYDYADGIFTYKYWDERTHFANEIYDADGNVVGFVGIDTSSFKTSVEQGE